MIDRYRLRRRDLLSSGALLAAGGLAGMPALAAPARSWGLQLFTVIAALEQDFEGTLKTVARIGYKEVETIGSFGRDPARVRALLDTYGLASPSQHVASDALYGIFSAWTRREIGTDRVLSEYAAAMQADKGDALIEGAIVQAKALGQRFVIWPILLDEHLASRAALAPYIALFNRAGAACSKAGLTFAFHNHDREFGSFGNDVIYDIILKETDPATVAMEMDFYWFAKAKADPIAYLAAHPGRFRLAHVKDMAADGDFAVVGKGVIDIKGQIAKARAAGVGHFLVEYDRPADPLREIRESFDYLQKIG